MSRYKNSYEGRRISRTVRIIIFLSVVSLGLTAFSKFYLEDRNRILKDEVTKLRTEKETLSNEVNEIEKNFKEKEKSYNELLDKLNQVKK